MVTQAVNGVNVEREYGHKVLTETQWYAVKQLLSDMATLYQTRFANADAAYDAYDYLGYNARMLAQYSLNIPYTLDPNSPENGDATSNQDAPAESSADGESTH